MSRVVLAQNLAANSKVIHSDGLVWDVVSRSNQYPSYEIKRGWYLGATAKDGSRPGRVPGVHHIGKGAVDAVIVHLERHDMPAPEVLRVAPDHEFLEAA